MAVKQVGDFDISDISDSSDDEIVTPGEDVQMGDDTPIRPEDDSSNDSSVERKVENFNKNVLQKIKLKLPPKKLVKKQKKRATRGLLLIQELRNVKATLRGDSSEAISRAVDVVTEYLSCDDVFNKLSLLTSKPANLAAAYKANFCGMSHLLANFVVNKSRNKSILGRRIKMSESALTDDKFLYDTTKVAELMNDRSNFPIDKSILTKYSGKLKMELMQEIASYVFLMKKGYTMPFSMCTTDRVTAVKNKLSAVNYDIRSLFLLEMAMINIHSQLDYQQIHVERIILMFECWMNGVTLLNDTETVLEFMCDVGLIPSVEGIKWTYSVTYKPDLTAVCITPSDLLAVANGDFPLHTDTINSKKIYRFKENAANKEENDQSILLYTKDSNSYTFNGVEGTVYMTSIDEW